MPAPGEGVGDQEVAGEVLAPAGEGVGDHEVAGEEDGPAGAAGPVAAGPTGSDGLVRPRTERRSGTLELSRGEEPVCGPLIGRSTGV